jgi:hypothetical protein
MYSLKLHLFSPKDEAKRIFQVQSAPILATVEQASSAKVGRGRDAESKIDSSETEKTVEFKDYRSQSSSIRDDMERELQVLRLKHERKVADLEQVSNAEIFELSSKLAEKRKEIHAKLDEASREFELIKQTGCQEKNKITTEKLEKELDEVRSEMATKDSNILNVREELSRSLTYVTLLQDQLKTANHEVAEMKSSEESTLKKLEVLRIENEALLKANSQSRIQTPVDGSFVSIPGNIEILEEQLRINASKVSHLEAEMDKHRLEVSEQKSQDDLERCSLQSELEMAKKSYKSLQEKFDLKSLELEQLKDNIVKQENVDENAALDYKMKYEALLESYKLEQVIL